MESCITLGIQTSNCFTATRVFVVHHALFVDELFSEVLYINRFTFQRKF